MLGRVVERSLRKEERQALLSEQKVIANLELTDVFPSGESIMAELERDRASGKLQSQLSYSWWLFPSAADTLPWESCSSSFLSTLPRERICHHRLVYIHPYANGNGRHARLAADLLLISMKQKRFSWGGVSLVDAGQTRARYIQALRAADGNDYAPLLMFVRTWANCATILTQGAMPHKALHDVFLESVFGGFIGGDDSWRIRFLMRTG